MKYPGVSLHSKGKWQARMWVNGKRKSLGTTTDWFEAVCLRKAAENLYPKAGNIPRRLSSKQYPLKDCPYCGKPISRISRKGKILKKGHYDQKKTCGAPACYRAALQAQDQPLTYNPVGQMDYFIYRMPCAS